MMHRVKQIACLSCLAAFALAAAACGNSTGNSTTTQSPLRGSPVATRTATSETPGAGGGALIETPQPPIKISVSNIKFDQTQLMASPGKITIEFDNNDANVTHNFALYKSAADTSTPLGATPITVGPDKQTLTITLDQGEYYYQCEVHPQLMNGKLIVH